MKIVPLNEQEYNWFPADYFTPSEAAHISSSKMARVEITWPSPETSGRWKIKPKGWVGVIPVQGGLSLRIEPKVPLTHLFKLDQWLSKSSHFKIFSDLAPISTMAGLIEFTIRALCARVERRLRVGLMRSYSSRREAGMVPRGAINVSETVKRLASGRVSSVWDERFLTPDNDDNRIIAYAIDIARRAGWIDPLLMKDITRISRSLSAQTTLMHFRVRDCEQRYYRKGFEDYASIHALCSTIINACAPTPSTGVDNFFQYGIDVPNLFEKLVAHELAGKFGKSLSQKPKYDIGMGKRVEPDLLIARNDSFSSGIVLDTKYKTEIKDADLYQAVTYAEAAGLTHSALVYPLILGRYVYKVGKISVMVTSFDMSKSPRDALTGLMDDLEEFINEANLASL